MVMARAGAVAVLLAVLALAAASGCQAAKFSGTCTKRGLNFMGDFCFEVTPTGDSAAGRIVAEVQTTFENVFFALYDDQPDSWAAVYNNPSCNCSCLQAHTVPNMLYSVSTTTPSTFEVSITEHIRSRFWWAALISCDSSMDGTYTLSMVQEDGSEFGVNQQGLLALWIICTVLWGIGLAMQGWASRWLWKARTFHPIVKLFTLTVAFWELSNLCLMIHWAAYAGNGAGVPFFEGLGRISEVVARVAFLLLIMLIATGWTISSNVLRNRVQLLLAIGIILVCYLVLAFWDLLGRDPASLLYVYDSTPGIIVVVGHLALLVWFLWRLHATYKQEVHSEKRKFYFLVGVVYGLWFLLLPFVVLVGSAVSPRVRQKTVETVLMILNTLAVTVLGFLMWPSRAHHYFDIQADSFVGTTQQYENL